MTGTADGLNGRLLRTLQADLLTYLVELLWEEINHR